jgi:hypothetical protein
MKRQPISKLKAQDSQRLAQMRAQWMFWSAMADTST